VPTSGSEKSAVSDAAPPIDSATVDASTVLIDSSMSITELAGDEISSSGYTVDELNAARRRKSNAHVRLMLPAVSGALDVNTVRRYVVRLQAELDLCYAAGLHADPSISGDVTIAFVIGQHGSVATASGTAGSKVSICLAHVLYGASFPAPKSGVVKVSYPMKLQLPD
jgi:hypothetical protein